MTWSNLKLMSKKITFDDNVYTPIDIVKDIIDWVKPYGKVLIFPFNKL